MGAEKDGFLVLTCRRSYNTTGFFFLRFILFCLLFGFLDASHHSSAFLSKQVIVSKPQCGERRFVIYGMQAMQAICILQLQEAEASNFSSGLDQ